MTENFITDLRRNLRTLTRHQRQLSTGLIVSRAEDNPQTIGTIIRMNQQIADMDQFETNSLLARDFLDNSESALSGIGTSLQRVRELTIRAANVGRPWTSGGHALLGESEAPKSLRNRIRSW